MRKNWDQMLNSKSGNGYPKEQVIEGRIEIFIETLNAADIRCHIVSVKVRCVRSFLIWMTAREFNVYRQHPVTRLY
jgi:hypothetical protein